MARMKRHKAVLLAIVHTSGVTSPDENGTHGRPVTKDAVAPSRGSATDATTAKPESVDAPTQADREIERFLRVAVPHPDGSGWYDPTGMTPQLSAWLENTRGEDWDEVTTMVATANRRFDVERESAKIHNAKARERAAVVATPLSDARKPEEQKADEQDRQMVLRGVQGESWARR